MNYANVKSKRRLIALVVAAFGLAVAIVCVSLYWPPVAKQDVQGAIGQRDVYRQTQLSDKDVGVAGTHPVTVDDVKKFVQSAEFKALAASPEFQVVCSNPANFNVLTNQNFAHLAHDKAILNLFATGNVHQLLNNEANLLTAEQKAYLGNPQVVNTLQNKAVLTLLSRPAIAVVYSNQVYNAVFSHPAMHQVLTNGQFSNLATNASLWQSFVDSK